MDKFEHPNLLGKRIWMCQNCMQLWYSLNAVKIEIPQNRKLTREEYKDIINGFPYDTDDCRCKNCRYHRVLTGKVNFNK